MTSTNIRFLLFTLLAFAGTQASLATQVEGDLYTWHRVSVTFDGPETSESYPSAFLDHRLTVTFSHQDIEYVVPGFFAADGDAGRSHATAGNKWRAYFTPDRVGKWTYRAEFAVGEDVAISGKRGKLYPLDGATGSFEIEASPVSMEAVDFRGHGRLNYVGKNHAQFAGSGKYFLKSGTGSPENFLAFDGFDGTWDDAKNPEFPSLGPEQLHHYGPHRGDWTSADPFWTNSEGRDSKGIVGVVNYIAEQGLNSFYLMPLTYLGDGCDVWPWVNPENRETFDVSKLDQWEQVFSHMQQKGIHIHMLVTETENENLFELFDGGGDFADTRKLYYRELVARFGHHLALSWDLGEENGWTDEKGGEPGLGNTAAQRKAFCSYIDDLDAYDHPMKAHEIEIVDIYDELFGFEDFDGPALQRHADYNKIVASFVERSNAAGRPWLVSMDEPLGWEFGLRPDADDPSRDGPRKEVLWGTYMAGGSGVEWYFGWQNNAPTSDLSAEDLRVREGMWKQTTIAHRFFTEHVPFQEMAAANDLVKGEDDYVFAKKNEVYLVYLKNGGEVKLDLSGAKGEFEVRWFDPRKGGSLQEASVGSARGGGLVELGAPPTETAKDWAVLLKR